MYHPNIEPIKLLIEYGADPKLTTNDGLNLLHIACLSGNTIVVVYLIEKMNFDINEKDNRGTTPIHWAVYANNEQSVEYLIKKGAKLNVEDKSGITPLHMALMNSKTTVLGALLFNGAEENKLDGHSRSCIQYAKAMDIKQFFDLVKEKNGRPISFLLNFIFFSSLLLSTFLTIIAIMPCKNILTNI